MKTVKSDSFSEELDVILDFIALDSLDRAILFSQELALKIKELSNMPYKFRQSIYFNDEDIRDLVFKGYTVPYFIDKEKNTIFILGILKYKNALSIKSLLF